MSTPAAALMRRYNANGLIGTDSDGATVMIEDVRDPDGRVYRLEYRSNAEGTQAVAYCRHNPWGTLNGNAEYTRGHVSRDGFLCLGSGATSTLAKSPFTLAYAIERGRYWCTAFSYFKETGTFPTP